MNANNKFITHHTTMNTLVAIVPLTQLWEQNHQNSITNNDGGKTLQSAKQATGLQRQESLKGG